MSTNDTNNNNSNTDDTKKKNRYCMICGKNEKDVGPFVTVPPGMPVCNSCMQKLLDQATGMALKSKFILKLKKRKKYDRNKSIYRNRKIGKIIFYICLCI